jgi:hypothetical protein
MTDEIKCKHCPGSEMFREPRDQEIPRPREGVVEIHELWTCSNCLSTFLFNKTEREMKPHELVRWAKWLNKQVEVA